MSNWRNELHELFDPDEGGRPTEHPETRTVVERLQDFHEEVALPALRQLRDELSKYGDVEVPEPGRQGAYLSVVFEPKKIDLLFSFRRLGTFHSLMIMS